MKKIIILCFVLFFLSGCAKHAASETGDMTEETSTVSSAPAAAEDVRRVLVETLQQNGDMLTHYANAKAGGMVVLFGLEENMNEIKTAAKSAAEKTSQCQTLVQSCCNKDALKRCYDESKNIQLRLENCNDKIKAAKNAGDIDTLKLELDNLLAVIEDDCKLMDQYQKELKE